MLQLPYTWWWMQSKLSSSCCLNQTRGHIYRAVSYSCTPVLTQVFSFFLTVIGTFSFISEHYIVIKIVIFALLLFQKTYKSLLFWNKEIETCSEIWKWCPVYDQIILLSQFPLKRFTNHTKQFFHKLDGSVYSCSQFNSLLIQ